MPSHAAAHLGSTTVEQQTLYPCSPDARAVNRAPGPHPPLPPYQGSGHANEGT